MRSNFDDLDKVCSRSYWLVAVMCIFAMLVKLATLGGIGWLIYYAINRFSA